MEKVNRGKWLVVEVRCSPGDRDRVIEVLWQHDTTGLEEREETDRLCLRAFFEGVQSLERFIDILKKDGDANSDDPLDIAAGWVEFDADEWITNYRDHFQGERIDDFFYVYPSWGTPSSQVEMNIQIEPGHAFGTGSHESTRLALKAVYWLAPGASRIADVGTGSGILAIAAALLNPKAEILALDNSSQSVQAARENVMVNGPLEQIHLVVGEPASINSSFDLLVANLTLEIFRDLAALLSSLCSRDLVLSGFTNEQEKAVVALFCSGEQFRVDQSWQENGWTCLHLVKKP